MLLGAPLKCGLCISAFVRICPSDDFAENVVNGSSSDHESAAVSPHSEIECSFRTFVKKIVLVRWLMVHVVHEQYSCGAQWKDDNDTFGTKAKGVECGQ
jgi:hypothetical protein